MVENKSCDDPYVIPLTVLIIEAATALMPVDMSMRQLKEGRRFED